MEYEEWRGRMGERWVWRMCNIWEESTLQFGLGAMWSWGDPGGLQSLKEGLRLSQYSKSSTYELSGCCGGGLVAKVLFNSYNPMDCSPPGSSVHGISQARILEWVAISFSRGSSQPRDRTKSLALLVIYCIVSRFFTDWAIREASYKCSKMWTCLPTPVCQLLCCTTILFKALDCKIKNVFFIFCLFFVDILFVLQAYDSTSTIQLTVLVGDLANFGGLTNRLDLPMCSWNGTHPYVRDSP